MIQKLEQGVIVDAFSRGQVYFVMSIYCGWAVVGYIQNFGYHGFVETLLIDDEGETS